jgi:hypothetical protein
MLRLFPNCSPASFRECSAPAFKTPICRPFLRVALTGRYLNHEAVATIGRLHETL